MIDDVYKLQSTDEYKAEGSLNLTYVKLHEIANEEILIHPFSFQIIF